MEQKKTRENEQLIEESIRSFMRGDMRTALVLILWGLVAFAIGAWCWSTQPDLMLQGLSFPVMIFASIHLGSGLLQFFQTRKRAAKLLLSGIQEYAVLMEELLRLDLLLPRLKFLRKTTLAVVLIGLAMSLAGSVGGFGKYMTGTGAGLALQAAVTISIDLFSGMRASLFHHELRRFLDGRF